MKLSVSGGERKESRRAALVSCRRAAPSCCGDGFDHLPNKSKITSLRKKESMSKRERVKSGQLVMTVVRTVPVDATRHGR